MSFDIWIGTSWHLAREKEADSRGRCIAGKF